MINCIHPTTKMSKEINESVHSNQTKFCCYLQCQVNVPDKCVPYQSCRREWTRNAPMGALLNPRMIPAMKITTDQGTQAVLNIKETVTVPKRPVIPRDYDINPRLKTMYSYHFNDTGDAILGYCDNRSQAERHRYFKNCQKLQNDLMEAIKNRNRSHINIYRSNRNKRITEYMAETSYIGGKIMSNRIHDHSNCGKTPNRCVHYIDF